MYHTIEFDRSITLDIAVSPKHPLERVSVKKGTRLRAQIKPHVIENEDGLIEVADLYFEDGTTTCQIPFAFFSFVE